MTIPLKQCTCLFFVFFQEHSLLPKVKIDFSETHPNWEKSPKKVCRTFSAPRSRFSPVMAENGDVGELPAVGMYLYLALEFILSAAKV